MDMALVKALFMLIIVWDSGNVGFMPPIPFMSVASCESYAEQREGLGFRKFVRPYKAENGKVAKYKMHCIPVDQENMIVEEIDEIKEDEGTLIEDDNDGKDLKKDSNTYYLMSV